MLTHTIVAAHDAGTTEIEAVNAGLRAFNFEQLGYNDGRRVVLLVRDEDGEIAGGLLGYTFWDWLAIDTLWLDETVRDQGLGTQLLQAAEREAIDRGISRALVDTMDWQAPDFYRRHGYELFGELDGFAGDHKRYYFRKQLI